MVRARGYAQRTQITPEPPEERHLPPGWEVPAAAFAAQPAEA
jgi:hypothetical protein